MTNGSICEDLLTTGEITSYRESAQTGKVFEVKVFWLDRRLTQRMIIMIRLAVHKLVIATQKPAGPI